MFPILPLILAVIALTLVVLALTVKLVLLKWNLRRLSEQYHSLLAEDTNALLRLSSSDGDLKKLAAVLDEELEKLRGLRRKYLNGDRRLKDAVTNISHDLRTPLTAVKGYLELLEKSTLSENQHIWLEVVRRRTEEMALLTEELFRYAVIANREDEPEKTEVNVGEVLEECLLSFYATFKAKGIESVNAICTAKIVRLTDRTSLYRIFSNILSNALKYAEKSFSVSMNEEGLICFSNRAESLTHVDAERLFDRYFTVKSNLNATGLGLSIARMLSEKLGFGIAAVHKDGELKVILKV